ncbi:MAG: alpha/beta fold hydrolase [Patescibacteria group bacterium]
MEKRVYIIHGWDGYPEEGWFPWLKRELEARGFKVFVPQMPSADEPRINNWIPAIKNLVKDPDEHTYFVGHSMGCQAIARYIEIIPKGIKIGGAVFVAGFFKRLTNLEDEDMVRSVADEWLRTPLNLEIVAKHIKKSIAVFSDNDPYVPIDNKDDFLNFLHSKIIIEHSMGHFSGSTGVKELPVVLKSVLEFISREILNLNY